MTVTERQKRAYVDAQAADARVNVEIETDEGMVLNIGPRHPATHGTLRVTAKPPGSTATPEVGPVTFVNNAADTATGTIQLKGTFANQDEGLTPGQLVDTVLTLYTLNDAVTVPDAAISFVAR